MKIVVLTFLLLLTMGCGESSKEKLENKKGPKISFTFDDGTLEDKPGYSFLEWNEMLLDKLDATGVKSIFFVTGGDKTSEKGSYLIKSWNDRGHSIANHTLTHPNYNSKKVSYLDFVKEIQDNDSIISKYSNYIKLFRFPYLNEGNTRQKADDFKHFMRTHDYRNGYVTIDASDWFIDRRLVYRLSENPDLNLNDFKKLYLDHTWEMAQYFEELSYSISKRHINHTLLLHHNLISALFIDDLIHMFKEKGWQIIPASQAYTDSIYFKRPLKPLEGESLISAIAREHNKGKVKFRTPPRTLNQLRVKIDEMGL